MLVSACRGDRDGTEVGVYLLGANVRRFWRVEGMALSLMSRQSVLASIANANHTHHQQHTNSNQLLQTQPGTCRQIAAGITTKRN